AVGAVYVQRAEDRAFPAAETVERHRHRNRYVDADHAGLDTMRELARGAAVAGEHGGPVAVFVRVDEAQRSVEICHADHAQHRADNLFPIDAHVRSDLVEQASPQKKSIGASVGAASSRELFLTFHLTIPSTQTETPPILHP